MPGDRHVHQACLPPPCCLRPDPRSRSCRRWSPPPRPSAAPGEIHRAQRPRPRARRSMSARAGADGNASPSALFAEPIATLLRRRQDHRPCTMPVRTGSLPTAAPSSAKPLATRLAPRQPTSPAERWRSPPAGAAAFSTAGHHRPAHQHPWRQALDRPPATKPASSQERALLGRLCFPEEGLKLMLFMVIERFKDRDPIPVYRRVRDEGVKFPGWPSNMSAAGSSRISTAASS